MTQDRHNQGVRVGIPRHNAYWRQTYPAAGFVAPKRDGVVLPPIPSRVVALDKLLWPILWIGLGVVTAWLTFKVIIANAADLTATRTPITHSTSPLPLLIGGPIVLGMLTAVVVLWRRKRGQLVAVARKATSFGMAILAFLALVGSMLVTSGVASASPSTSVTLYATPNGTATSGCTSASDGCSLAGAITVGENDSGDAVTIYLVHSSGALCATNDPCTFDGDQTISSTADAASITIEPDGAPNATAKLDGNNSASSPGTVFMNDAGTTTSVSLDYLTITGGYTANGAASGTGDAGGAGGIYNGGTMTITNLTISGNETGNGGIGTYADGGDGGGIYNGGTMTITDSNISDNKTGNGGNGNDGGVGGNGGGIYNDGGTITITGSTISDNETGTGGTSNDAAYGGSGGGIDNLNGTITITASTISDNVTGAGGSGGADGGNGGGIYNDGTTNVKDSTISGNETGNGGTGTYAVGGSGGGIYNSQIITITDSTISSNKTGNGGSSTDGGAGGSGGGIDNDGETMTITGCTISNNETGTGGTVGSDGVDGGDGGGIYNGSGTTTITNSTILDNETGNGGNGGTGTYAVGGSGGGIYNSQIITITDSTISGNKTGSGGTGTSGGAGGSGGGIDNDGGTMTITGSTISDNDTGAGGSGGADGGNGGGIYNDGTTNVTDSTTSGNETGNGTAGGVGGSGGGIYNSQIITITDSTISGNKTGSGGAGGSGGGIDNDGGTMTIISSTISDNETGTGGSSGTVGGNGGGISGTNINLAGAIVANNVGGSGSENCYGSSKDSGYNISNGSSCDFTATGSEDNATVNLGSLANNGGSTETIALLSGSAGLNAIPVTATVTVENPTTNSNETIDLCGASSDSSENTFAGVNLAISQNGFPRNDGKYCNAGAWEVYSTTTTVTCSPQSSAYGTTVNCTATVVNNLTTPPSGTVTITTSTGQSCTATLSDGTGSCSLTDIPPGTISVTASYSGDQDNQPSSGTTSLTVTKDPTSTSISASPSSGVAGTQSTVTVVVVNTFFQQPATGGTVTIAAGSTTICTAPLGSSGTVQCTTPLPVGSEELEASYSGTATELSSSGTIIISGKQSTTTTVTCSPQSPAYGTTVNCTATVVNNLTTPPSGTVTITTSTGQSCTATLSDGTGSCSLTDIPPGTISVTASYSGDQDNEPSSGTISLTVTKDTASTTISASPSSGVAGTKTTLTVVVVNTSLQQPATGGTVTIAAGSTTICTAPLGSKGTVQCTTPLPVGSEELEASYSGTTTESPSSGSTTISGKQSTTTRVTCSPQSSTYGTTVNCTATVVNNLTTPPSGTVTITTSTGHSCTATLSDGTGSCSLTDLPPGTISVTASYSGDQDNEPSSGTTNLTVTKDPTSTSINASPSSGVAGTKTTLTVVVVNTSFQEPATGGRVIITASNTTICAPSLGSSGTVQCTTPLPVGSEELEASYSGTTTESPSSGSTTISGKQPIIPLTCTGTSCNSTPPPSSSCHGNDCHLTHPHIPFTPSGKHRPIRVISKCPAHKHCVVPTQTVVTCNPTLESIPDLRYVACTITVKADDGVDIPGGTLTVTHYGMHRVFTVGRYLSFVLSPWKPPAKPGRYLVSASYSGYQIDGIDYLPSVGSIKIVLGTLVCPLPTAHDSGWWWFGSSLPWWLILAALILGTLWVISYRRYNPQELAGSLIREGAVNIDDEEDDDQKGSE